MAHNLQQMTDGSYSYVGRQAGWHKLGSVKGNHFAWRDVAAEGGLNFEVVKNQLQYAGENVNAWGTFRSDNGAFLGAVGEDYRVIQHTRGFEMLDALVAAKDGSHYETAGVLGKGEVIWGLIDLNQALTVGAFDKSQPYLLFSTSHDGSKSHNYRLVFERVVCANTLGWALAEKTRAQLTVRHTQNANSRLDKIHDTLAGLGNQITDMSDRLNFLAERRVTKESVSTIMDRLFPADKDEDGKPKPDSTRRLNIIGKILERFECNDENVFPEQRGTAYNLLNGVTEYVDHYRDGTRGGERDKAAMFGTGALLKSQALEVITLAANGMPVKARTQTFVAPAVVPAVHAGVLAASGTPYLDSILAGLD